MTRVGRTDLDRILADQERRIAALERSPGIAPRIVYGTFFYHFLGPGGTGITHPGSGDWSTAGVGPDIIFDVPFNAPPAVLLTPVTDDPLHATDYPIVDALVEIETGSHFTMNLYYNEPGAGAGTVAVLEGKPGVSWHFLAIGI